MKKIEKYYKWGINCCLDAKKPTKVLFLCKKPFFTRQIRNATKQTFFLEGKKDFESLTTNICSNRFEGTHFFHCSLILPFRGNDLERLAEGTWARVSRKLPQDCFLHIHLSISFLPPPISGGFFCKNNCN